MVTTRKASRLDYASIHSGGTDSGSSGIGNGARGGKRKRSTSSPSASAGPARQRTLRSNTSSASSAPHAPRPHSKGGKQGHATPSPSPSVLPRGARAKAEEEAAALSSPLSSPSPPLAQSRPRRTAQRQNPRADLNDMNADERDEDEVDSEASNQTRDEADDDDDDEKDDHVAPAPAAKPKAAKRKANKPKAASTTIIASTSSAATASTSSAHLPPAVAQEVAQRTQMLSLLAPIAAAPPRELPANVPYHKAVRQYFAGLKDCRLYQLSERPASAPAWRDVVAQRRDSSSLASGGFVNVDALKPSVPLPIRQLDEAIDEDRAAIERASSYASPFAREAVGQQRIFALPFAMSLETAPILGVDEVNLTVRSSTGETILQRFSPTSRKQSMTSEKDWRQGGKAVFDALFARQPQAEERDGNLGQVIHCGGWSYPGGRYGWSDDHSQRRPESDDALRWIWRWFHAHVITLACYLERDFQEDLAMREAGFQRYKRLMGKSQTTLSHPWFSLASVTKGHETTEANHGSDKEPSILTTFEEPILLYVAHHEGFFKTVVRPGQVVFLRSHKLHSVQPLTHPRVDKPRYGVSFATHKAIAGLETRSKKGRQRLKDPPQPAPGDKETRVSFAGAGNGRSSKKGTVASSDGGGVKARGKKKDGEDDWSSGSSSSGSSSSSSSDGEQEDCPELDFPCGGRLAWELEQGGGGRRAAVAAGGGGVAEEEDDDE